MFLFSYPLQSLMTLQLLLLLLVVSWIGAGADDYFSIAGYFPDYRKDMDVDSASDMLTDLILFSIEPGVNGEVEDVCCVGLEHYEIIRRAQAKKKKKKRASDLRLWLSVGGAGRSRYIGRNAGSDDSRKRLARHIQKVLRSQSLDGVDFDWEQPRDNEDFMNYMKLIRTVHHFLEPYGLKISIALHQGMLLPRQMYKYIDRVHLMTYDLDVHRGYHATFESTTKVVRQFIDSGAPPEKLLMGIPLYGRGIKNYGLTKAMYEIAEKGVGKPQFILEESSVGDMHWESQESIRTKIEWAKKEGLNGIFLWEIGQDHRVDVVAPGGMMLEHIYNTVSDVAGGVSDDTVTPGSAHIGEL